MKRLMMYDRCQSFGTLPMYIIWLKSDVKQTVTPSPATLIISMVIPADPAALPDFILLIALDIISIVILIAWSFYWGFFTHIHSIPWKFNISKNFDNQIASLSACHRQSKLAFHDHF